MFYQVFKSTQQIVAKNEINNFGTFNEDSIYELKESPIVFDLSKEYIPVYFRETQENLLKSIRPERDKLLQETDKYMLSDYPIASPDKTLIMGYRQKLRNLPETITLEKPEFPVKPNFINEKDAT